MNNFVYIRLGSIVLLLTLFWANARAQSENVWAFGNGAGLNLGNNTMPLETSLTHGRYREAAASVCDAQGNLLFYTEGDTIWNRSGQVMPNGAGVTGHAAYELGGGTYMSPTTSTWQGAQIVPIPDRPYEFYLFSLTSFEWGDSSGRLYYSLIDMRLDGGNGDVVSSQKGILLDSNLTEQMLGVAGLHCNSWLIVIPKNDDNQQGNQFKAFEINASGIQPTPVVSNVGGVYFGGFLGKLVASRDGKKMALARSALAGFAQIGGPIELYDFDRATGTVSGDMVLGTYSININNPIYLGICFSPDQTRLYGLRYKLGEPLTLDQFDLSIHYAATILASRTVVDTMPQGTDIRMGGNDKLYYLSDSVHLGIIHQPNLPGLACQPETYAIQLLPGTANGLRLPSSVPFTEPDSLYAYAGLSAGCFSPVQALQAEDSTGWDYTWSTGDTGSVISVEAPGRYWVRYYSAPCIYHADSFEVSFPHGRLPDLHFHAECRVDSNGYAYASTYPGDPVNYSYVWMQGGDTLSTTDTLAAVPSGSYAVHISTNTGCDTLLFFDIPEEAFRATFNLSDTLICLGETVSLTNTSDNHFTAFEWDFGNGDLAAAFEPPAYQYGESGVYVIRLAASGAICSDTAYRTIYVDRSFSPRFGVDPREVCVGRPVYFFPEVDSTVRQLQWAISGKRRQAPAVESRYQYAFDSTGIFPVTLTAIPRACPDTSITDSIYVYPFPEVDLGSDRSICLKGHPVYLKNLHQAPLSPYHQVWSTGDTTEVLKVVRPGTYSLKVSSGPVGCTTTETVTISKDCYIDIPNAFTPDGDGYNDYFLPRQLLSESLSRFKMQVYNRWGQLVFETRRLNGRGWDGRLNGQAQPMGVYLYRIEADFSNGRQEHYEGNVTLLR